MIRKHLLISGRMQGVGYRASLLAQAVGVDGVSGWVRNLSDGRVEAVIQGPSDAVKKLVEWCRIGPPYGEVTKLIESDEAADPSLKGFEQKRTK